MSLLIGKEPLQYTLTQIHFKHKFKTRPLDVLPHLEGALMDPMWNDYNKLSVITDIFTIAQTTARTIENLKLRQALTSLSFR